MALVRVYDFPDGTLEQYDQVMERFNNQIAPGNYLHAAGAVNGGFRAIDVYESRDAADQIAGMVAAAAGEVGLTPPSVSEFETHNMLRA
jgi:hypothetical protein